MNHRGKLIFVIVCGLMGSLVSLWLLPPVVNEFGQSIARNMWEVESNKRDNGAITSPVPNPKDAVRDEPVKEEAPELNTGGDEDPAKVEGGDEVENPDPPVNTTGDEGGSEVKTDETDTDGTGESTADTELKESGAKEKRVINQSGPGPVEDSVAETNFSASPFAIGLFGFIVGLAIGGFLVRQGERIGDKWDKSPSGDKLTIMLGSIMGVIAGILVSLPFLLALQGRPEGALLTIGMVVGCSAAMIYLLRSLGPYLPWETSSISKRTGLKILDTNVLIDGRVYDLIRTGFLDGDLYVPQFVLLELQHIADSADGLKRQRGRRGLDVLNRIRSEFEVEVGNRDRYAGSDKDEVDTRLMKLCKSLGADLVSNDFNLNRTATIQEIRVLNINELSLALRPNVLPGEIMEIQVIKEGNQSGQGVGYLNDGTMVVVEHGADLIGQGVSDVMVTQVIQTERGKMIFADASGDVFPPPEPPSRRKLPRGQK